MFQEWPGFLRRCRARSECATQDIHDWFGSIAMLVCVCVLSVVQRLVRLGQSTVCSCGRARTDGQVSRLTSLDWWVTNMIIQLQCLRVESTRNQQDVADFLDRHRISTTLSARVKKYIGCSQPQLLKERTFICSRRFSMISTRKCVRPLYRRIPFL